MKKCEVCGETEGTIHAPKKFSKMLCNRHYQQMYKYGRIVPDMKPEKKCEECGETKNAYYREKYKRILCGRHNQQMIRFGKIQVKKEKRCEVCGETDNAFYNKKHKRILCRRHFYQMSRYGKIQTDRNIEKKCDECGETKYVYFRKEYNKNLCSRHVAQIKKHGKIQVKTVKKCDECGETEGKIVNSDKIKKILCERHYHQMRKYGKILERTMYDNNDIILDGEVSYIILRNRKQEEVARAIIDTEDLENIRQYKWGYISAGYAQTNYKGRSMGLHRVVMNYAGKLEIDHINRDKLDNRKENLRIVTHQENMMNKGMTANNKSGVIGVHYVETHNSWVSTASIDGKSVRKCFKTKEEAIRARLLLEKEYYGNNAKQAHLFPKYNIA